MELEKLAAQYYAAEEGGGALYAAAERLRATLPETVRAALERTGNFHDYGLAELSLRGEALILCLRCFGRCAPKPYRVRLRFDGVEYLRLHGDFSAAGGDGLIQGRRGHPPAQVLALWRGVENGAYEALVLLDNGRWFCLRARNARCIWEKEANA